MSITPRKTPPIRKPTTAGTQVGMPFPPEISMAGARSDQKLAAIIIPAAKPREPSSSFLFTFLTMNTAAAQKPSLTM